MENKYIIDETIYSHDTIERTIEAFSEVTEILFKNGELIIKGDSNNEIDEIFNEFMNYVISLINE